MPEQHCMWMERPTWACRADEDYDPNRIGSISFAHVASALTEAGKVVLYPIFHVARYDLVFEDDGAFYRVQCKTGHLRSGAVTFPTASRRAAKRETGWRRVEANYHGEVDFFGVYCPENGKVYLVPINDAVATRLCYLRIEPTRNNQTKRIRWAGSYEVTPRVGK